jgi:hypothetical protein
MIVVKVDQNQLFLKWATKFTNCTVDEFFDMLMNN